MLVTGLRCCDTGRGFSSTSSLKRSDGRLKRHKPFDSKDPIQRHQKRSKAQPVFSVRRKEAVSFSSRERQDLLDRQTRVPWITYQSSIATAMLYVLRTLRIDVQQTLLSLGIDEFELQERWAKFADKIESSTRLAQEKGIMDQKSNPLFNRLWELYSSKEALKQDIRFLFFDSVLGRRFSEAEVIIQKKLTDCRYPSEWFPATRALQRKIIMHVGPTNSGKTYHALKRLEEAESGIFAGPLRLLAHEVYSRFNANGKPCSLITGEEQRVPEGMTKNMSSCTIEMVPLNTKVDVAVIDEIQMIANESRGWAWTQAFLGLQAKELHVCGEARTVPLIRDLCAYIGDSLEVHEYERLSPLSVERSGLGSNIGKLQKGDALVVFSRKQIHTMKDLIEKAHPGKQCAMIYGSLPPETRAQQAELFNDPENDVDFLCASDAIGMGLNLSIKRVVFESTMKFDGNSHRSLEVAQIKQIAGRAGRFKTSHQAMRAANLAPLTANKLVGNDTAETGGTVTVLEDVDHRELRTAMRQDLEPITVALCFPPISALTRFAALFPPETPFSYILLKFQDMTAFNPRFKHATYEDHIIIADIIQKYDLTISERLTVCSSPARNSVQHLETIAHFARCIAEKSGGELLEVPSLPWELLNSRKNDAQTLRNLEALHHNVMTYLWLTYRFNNIFTSRDLAFHVSGLVEQRIQQCLHQVPIRSSKIRRLEKKQKKERESSGTSTTPQTLPEIQAEA